MEDLREQARGVGGEVISILGNHEWMNAIGEWPVVCLLHTAVLMIMVPSR